MNRDEFIRYWGIDGKKGLSLARKGRERLYYRFMGKSIDPLWAMK
ncbi:MAG: hypothetical protein AABY32_01810 [Nanoarchaeota archaeon]